MNRRANDRVAHFLYITTTKARMNCRLLHSETYQPQSSTSLSMITITSTVRWEPMIHSQEVFDVGNDPMKKNAPFEFLWTALHSM